MRQALEPLLTKKAAILIISFLFFLNPTFACADDKEKLLAQELEKYAPEWTVFEACAGHIKQTDQAYVAAILTKNSSEVVRLVVYLRKPDNTLALLVDTPRAICADCGGIKGEHIPFSLSITDGVLSIDYEGGSSWVSRMTTKWRYQNGGFYLIGITEITFDTLSDDHWSITRDVNVSTLKMFETLYLPHNKKTLSCVISKKYRAFELISYSHEYLLENMPQCSDAKLP